MNPTETLPVKSADRVIEVFELLALATGGLTHSEIAEALAIPKSSLTVLLKTVSNRGYLTLDPAGRRFTLGPRFVQLAQQLARARDLVGAARPILAEMSAASGETSALSLLEGSKAKVACSVDSPQRLMSQLREGDLAPLYATSSGKALLAYLTEAQRSAYFSETPLIAFTARTITRIDVLEAQLDRIRGGEVAEVIQEYTDGVVGLALPVLTGDDTCLGAISISMPAIRFDADVRRGAGDTLHAARAALVKAIGG